MKVKQIALLVVPLLVIVGLLASGGIANALPSYAAATGQACGVCHVSAAGGGALTPLGQRFAAIANRATDPAGAFAQAQAAQATPTTAPAAATATTAPAAATATRAPAAATATAAPGGLPTTGDELPMSWVALGALILVGGGFFLTRLARGAK